MKSVQMHFLSSLILKAWHKKGVCLCTHVELFSGDSENPVLDLEHEYMVMNY